MAEPEIPLPPPLPPKKKAAAAPASTAKKAAPAGKAPTPRSAVKRSASVLDAVDKIVPSAPVAPGALRAGPGQIAHNGGSLALGLIAYAIGINYLRFGWPGVKSWFSAKLMNRPTQTGGAPNTAGGAFTTPPAASSPLTLPIVGTGAVFA